MPDIVLDTGNTAVKKKIFFFKNKSLLQEAFIGVRGNRQVNKHIMSDSDELHKEK